MATNQDVNIKINVDSSRADSNTDSLKKRLKELRDQMVALKAAGKDTSEEYQKLSKEAANLTDAMGDVSQEVKNLANDNQTLAATMQGVGAGVAVFGGLQAATALLGVEDKNLLQIMQKVQAAQALLNSVNTIANALNKSSALMTALRAKSEKSLNQELNKTTVAEEKGTAATTAYTAAEGAATTGAITLKGAVKAVGTAIKSVPVVGWILAAISAIVTLISLISDANEEEEKGNDLLEERKKKIEEVEQAHRNNIKAIEDENRELSKLLSSLDNGSGALYEDAIRGLSSYTGVAEEYLRKLSTEEAENLKNTVLWYKQTKENVEDLKRQVDEGVLVPGTEDFKQAQIDIINGNAAIKSYEETINAEREKGYKYTKQQAAATKQLQEAEKERNKFIEDSRKEIEELNNAIYGQDEEEKLTEKYDKLLDYAIKYYGEESEQAAKVTEMRLKGLEEIRQKEEQAEEELAKQRLEDERKDEDKALNAQKAILEQKLSQLDIYSDEYLAAVEQQYDLEYQIAMTELQRQLNDQEILESEYNARSLMMYEDLERKKADLHKEEQDRINAQDLANTESMIAQFGKMTSEMLEADLEKVKGNEEEEARVRKKYARATFLSQVASIGIDTAKAIMSIWSTAGQAGIAAPAYGTAMTALIMATSAAQIAKAKSAMDNALKYEKGGLIEGPRHSNGGVNINAEGGEFVMNRRATSAFLPVLQEMNNIGRPSTVDSPSIISQNMIRQIVTETVNGIAAIPVTVTEQNITTAQRNVSVLENRSLF